MTVREIFAALDPPARPPKVRRRTPRAAPARTVATERTQHDLANAWREARGCEGFLPIYSDGALHVPAPSGLWRALSANELQVDVFSMHNGEKLCRKTSEARAICEQIEAIADMQGFFADAASGVVSPAGFHQLSAEGLVCTTALELSHRQTFELEWAPDAEQEAPLLDGLLRAAFEGDHCEEQVALFWQAVGASLFGLMPRHQVAMLLLGRERSGKSVLQRVLERAFPQQAVAAVSPASWGHEYHVAALAGKRLNVVGELPDDAPLPAASFKNVTGQNLVAGRHPTHRPFSFRCQAAHWFASNVLPHTTDRSEAFFRRWRVLRFANTVPADRVDPRLLDKIVADEMPAILAQAFAGAEQVARAGGLRTTTPHDEVLSRWRLAANPLQQFLADDEWVQLDPAAATHGVPELYAVYRRWAALAGFRNPFGRNAFRDMLEATGATRGVVFKRVGTRELVVGLTLRRTE